MEGKNNRPKSKKKVQQKSLTMRETSNSSSSWVIPERKPMTLRRKDCC